MRKFALAHACVAAACIAATLSGLAAVPAFSQTADPKPKPTSAHVYLLRGIFNVFSPGIDELGDKLQRRGINATVHNHTEWALLAGRAITNCTSGRESPIILVGHSFGADAAYAMAERLGQQNVKVSLVVTLDPTNRNTVSGNVNRVANYYLSNGVGMSVERGSTFHGSLQNVDMKSQGDLGHVSLTTSDAIQKKIMSDVLASLHGRCQ